MVSLVRAVLGRLQEGKDRCEVLVDSHAAKYTITGKEVGILSYSEIGDFFTDSIDRLFSSKNYLSYS